MKKLIVACAAVAMAVPVCSYAAAWNAPTNVRIVQKSNTDTAGRIYGTIQAAINSITGASATNPFVVTVMPGVYNETVTLKPFVTLEGSGPENTIITAAATATDGGECTKGTLVMAANSVVKNLTVKRTYTGPSVLSVDTNAIIVPNVAATIDGVTADATTSLIAGDTNAVCLVGSAANLDIRDSIVSATSTTGGGTNAAYAAGGALGSAVKMTALRTKFTMKTSGLAGDVINFDQLGAEVTINDSIIERTGAGVVGYDFLNVSSGGKALVTNSKILGGCMFQADPSDPSSLIIANSMIDIDKTPGCPSENPDKFVNNYDTKGNPIPNR